MRARIRNTLFVLLGVMSINIIKLTSNLGDDATIGRWYGDAPQF